MNWPMPQDFNEAIQNPALAFADSDLCTGLVTIGPMGVPLPRSGNFADVYQVKGLDGRDWAVKCFTRPVTGLDSRYARIGETLSRAKLPFTVGFTYLDKGIQVAGVWRPVVKMEWVEGMQLHRVVRENAGKPSVLRNLLQMWSRLCRRLRDAGIAHADLQHGNVLLVPGSRTGSYELKLIDYDGMYVPALSNTPTGETGHAAYRHPNRTASSYSPDLDRFPHLVVGAAIQALVHGGPSLWSRYDTGDNLLLTEKDFQNPAASKLMREMWDTGNSQTQALVGRLAIACGQPIPQTPWLDEIAPDGVPLSLNKEAKRDAEAALGLIAPVAVVAPFPALPPLPGNPVKPVKPAVSSVAIPVPLPKPKPAVRTLHDDDSHQTKWIEVANEVRDWDDDGDDGPSRRKDRLLWAIAGVMAVVVVAVAAIAFTGSSRPKPEHKPEEVAEAKGATEPNAVPKGDAEHSSKSKTGAVVPTPKLSTPTPTPSAPTPTPSTTPKSDPLPKDPPLPVVRDPVEISPRWTAAADSQGAPANLFIDEEANTILLGSERTPLMAFDLVQGTKLRAFAWIGLTGGDSFLPLDRGRVARCALDELVIETWEIKTGTTKEKYAISEIPPGTGTATHKYVRLSPNMQYLVVARTAVSGDDRPKAPLQVFDTKSGKPVLTTDWTGGSTHFTADSKRLLLAESNGRFRWLKLPGGEADGEWDYGAPGPSRFHVVTGISADGHVIGYKGPGKSGGDLGPCLIDGKNGDVLHRFGETYVSTSAVAVSADGKFAAVFHRRTKTESYIDVVTIPKGEAVARAIVPVSRTAFTFTLSARGDRLLVHDPQDGKLWNFDVPVK